jgi:hypothetical protein
VATPFGSLLKTKVRDRYFSLIMKNCSLRCLNRNHLYIYIYPKWLHGPTLFRKKEQKKKCAVSFFDYLLHMGAGVDLN